MSKSISNGLSVDIPVQATHSLKLAWLGGTYTAQIISGAANLPVALATNSASSQTFGPYATAIMVRLTVSAIGRVAWDTASTPVFIPPGEQFTRQDDGIPVTLSGVGPAAEFAVDGAGNSGGGVATDAEIAAWAGNLDSLITGAITRDANGAATAAAVTWPDGATGAYAATTVSTAFPGAVDAYTVTHVLGGVTKTATQSAVTRDVNGAVTARPAIGVV